MFMTKKRKTYSAYLMMSDFINDTWQSLCQAVYNLDNDQCCMCCIGAVSLYVGFHFRDMQYPFDMFKINYAEHPDFMQELEDAYSRLYKYASSEVAASYHEKIAGSNSLSRMRENPQNVIYDCYYGKIIYAMIRYSNFYETYWRSDMTIFDFGDNVYRFFVRKEPDVKQLVSKVKSLIS